ncbi:NYN domain-containing protein [Actinomadura sp. DSM 109109]|nr:NYN domain-containing protein [Actinomadura lepetitiana]
MPHMRTALYLDFDNVFSGLCELDPLAAERFAIDPGAWLRRLSEISESGARRRWLVLRCYLNPSGYVPMGAERKYFSRYRAAFVRAGFEIVDCPRYNATKNGADIRVVVDAIDALSTEPVCEEFIIASGDSDMTPLLQRLRRADRRTLIMSPVDAAEAYTSIADQVLNGHQMLALVQGESIDLDDDANGEIAAEGYGTGRPGTLAAHSSGAYEAFRAIVTREYDGAAEPLYLASLAQQVRDQLGAAAIGPDWFGLGGFSRALSSLDLPGLTLSQYMLWDETRHRPPEAGPQKVPVPEPIDRLGYLMNLPRLPQDWWPAVYGALSDYASEHTFNMTECTAWSRDRLADYGLRVSRQHIGFVMNGAARGGSPLYRDPPPTAEEIGEAFVRSVLNRIDSSEMVFTEEDIAVVREWLDAPVDTVTVPTA